MPKPKRILGIKAHLQSGFNKSVASHPPKAPLLTLVSDQNLTNFSSQSLEYVGRLLNSKR